MNRFGCLFFALVLTAATAVSVTVQPKAVALDPAPSIVPGDKQSKTAATKAVVPHRTGTRSSGVRVYKQHVKKKPHDRQGYPPLALAKPSGIAAQEATTKSAADKKVTTLALQPLPMVMPLAPEESPLVPSQNVPVSRPAVPAAPGGFHWRSYLKHWAPHRPRKSPQLAELSWVSDVTDAQAQQLANSIAAYIARLVPADSTTLLVAPTAEAQCHNPLTPALYDALRRSGFGLAESKSQAANAQLLRYQVSRLNDGIWLQIQLNQTQANRFYALSPDSTLVSNAPFAVREAK